MNEKPHYDRLSASLRFVIRRYYAQLRRVPTMAGASLLLPALGEVLSSYGPPLLVARLLGKFASGQHLTLAFLAPYVLGFAAMWLAGQGFWRLAMGLVSRVDIRCIEGLYLEALHELLARDLAFFQDNQAGSLTKRALGYARRFEDFFDALCFQVASSLLPLCFVAVVLWSYSPWLIVILTVMLAATFLMVFPLIRYGRTLVDIRESASNVLAGHIADSIANAEAVRAFARETHEARIHAGNVFDYGAKTLTSWDYQNIRVDMVTAPMLVLTNTLGLVVALWLGGRGGTGLEAIFITFSYYATATRVMWEFNRIYRSLEGALTDAAQFAELLLEPPLVLDREKTDAFKPVDFSIDFCSVRFRYGRSQPLLFDGLSLRVEPGTKIGLVGRSGGGKTTLARLLLRFYDVESGEIRIGGQAIERVPQAALRELIGYIPQDPAMFHRSVADNIRIGRPNATDAEVRCVAQLAHATEFIEALPRGYETLVGERGVKLSGGQRQRIAIARAMLKGAPILILDEATSSLDSESESLVQDALWKLLFNRTAIVIAHRLSTVTRMDELIILDAGKIAERGTHDELLAHNGIYATFWAQQSGDFIVTTGAPIAGR